MVNFGIARGEEEDGDLGEVPDFAAEIEAGEIGKANVEDCEVWGVRAEVIESLLCGGDMSDGKVLGFESIDQRIRDGGFIFDEQDRRHCDE